jgi:hypothetical protein
MILFVRNCTSDSSPDDNKHHFIACFLLLLVAPSMSETFLNFKKTVKFKQTLDPQQEDSNKSLEIK